MVYAPKYKQNQMVLGTGNPVIVTGWTVRESVAKKLEKHEYAAIGSLYSPTRGINFLVRNLLANPETRGIIILDATREDKNAGACQCLKDFFSSGVKEGVTDTGRDCWVIESKVTGYIDKEIPLSALNKLRRSLSIYEAFSIEKAITNTRLFNSLYPSVESWGEPMEFPYTEPVTTIAPGTRYGHRIEGKTIAETWVKILHRIKTTGTVRTTGYGGNWQELIDLIAVVTDEPPDFYFPEPNYLPLDRAFLDGYIPQILDDAPYQEGVKYTYGQRLRSWFGRDQIQQCIDKLCGEKDAASAVASLWDVKDHEKGGSPCLNHIWFRIVDNELSMTATFRSNDMFSAWPSNAMGLRALQRHVMEEINKRTDYNLVMAPLITHSESAHIYDDCWENVDRLIANQYREIIRKETLAYADPSGNFLIEWDGAIKVTHLTPGSGEPVGCYEGTNPLKLIRAIAADCPAIHPTHIGYLGIELERAREFKNDYAQDRK